MEKKKIVFLLLLFFAIMFRVYKIDQVPAGIFIDELAMGLNAKTIVESGADEFGRAYPFGFESFSDYKPPGYVYATALSYLFFGPSTMTIRFPAMVASIVSIFLIGFLTYLLFPKKKHLPYIAMIILGFSPFHIHFGRIAFETMLAKMFLLIYLISFLQLLKGKVKVWLMLGSICLLLSTWTYHAPRFIIPVFTFGILIYSIFLLPKELPKRKSILVSVFFLFISLISFLPYILNPEVDKRAIGYVTAGGNTSVIQSIFNKTILTFSSWMRMWNFEYLFMKGDLFGFRHSTGEAGVFFNVFLVPLIVGIGYLIKKFSFKNFATVFTLWLLIVTGLPSALTYIFPYGPRILPIVIPFSIIIALGSEQVFQYMKKRSLMMQYALIFVLSSVFLFQLVQFGHIYFTHYAKKSLPEFPKAPLMMAEYLKKEIPSRSHIFFLTGNQCFPWGFDELRLWYYADLPNNELIEWNNIFREKRYKTGNPFGSFDTLPRPIYTYKNVTLHGNEKQIGEAPSGSLIIRCGYNLPHINTTEETVQKIFYMYEQELREPIYVIIQKK